MARSAAADAVRRFRQRARPAGETIYNTDVERIAESIIAQLPPALDPNRAIVPAVSELLVLPRWAVVAYAARFARRVSPAFTNAAPPAVVDESPKLNHAIDVAEQAAGQGRRSPTVTQSARQAAVAVSDLTERIRHSGIWYDAERHRAGMTACAAADVVRAAGNATSVAADEFEVIALSVAVEDVLQTAKAAVEHVFSTSTIADLQRLRCVRRDFDRLAHLARKHSWTDDTPVPPDVFGPMWLHGLTPEWANEPPAG